MCLGIPGQIVEIVDETFQIAKVDVSGVKRGVSNALIASGGMLKLSRPDFCFIVPSHDLLAIQETHETLYHVLWELVHVFFEHEGMLK